MPPVVAETPAGVFVPKKPLWFHQLDIWLPRSWDFTHRLGRTPHLDTRRSPNS